MPDNTLSCPKCNKRMTITKGMVKCQCGYDNPATAEQIDYCITHGRRKRQVIEIDTAKGRYD